jgi:hypothetical protein
MPFSPLFLKTMIWSLIGSLLRGDFYNGMMKYSQERRVNRASVKEEE